MAPGLKLICVATSCFLCTLNAQAETLTDPTRPAFELISNASSSVSNAGTAGNTSNGNLQFVLQSVRISPQRRAATINGVNVEIGETIGNATLVAVRESSVLLKSAQGTIQELALFPSVQFKKVDVPASAAPATK